MRPVQRGVLVFVLAAFCLTKSLLCNVAVFTGMLFISKSSEFISLIWKEPFMTSSSVTSWKKATSVFKEDSVQIPTQRSRITCFHPDNPVKHPDSHQSATIRLDDVVILFGRPSVCRSFELYKVASI